MWVELVYAAVAVIALLYGPGYPFFRGLGLSRTLALCCAPLFSVCVYAVLPIAYYELGIECGLATLVLPAVAVGLGALVVSGLVAVVRGGGRRRFAPSVQEPISVFEGDVSFDLLVPLAYVLLATLVCALVFWRAMPSADALMPRFDNQTHINLTRAFLESGKWSSLHTSNFLASPSAMCSVAGDGGFYPAGWSCVVALTCLASGAGILASANAVISVVATVVFPLGIYAFLRALLPDRRRAVMLGAIASVGFANWPWSYVYTGPLSPNQMGIALQMSALAVLVLLVRRATPRRDAAMIGLGMPVAFVALALAHPSTVFSSYVFAVSLVGGLLAREAPAIVDRFEFLKVVDNGVAGSSELTATQRAAVQKAIVLVPFALLVVDFWLLCYNLPMLRSVIRYVEREHLVVGWTIYDLLGMKFEIPVMQFGMMLASAAGCTYVWRRREWRWMLLPVAFFAVGYVATRMDVWVLKHWVAALWYSDRRRMAGNLVLYLMPIAALGLDTLMGQPGRKAVPDAWRVAAGDGWRGWALAWLVANRSWVSVLVVGVLSIVPLSAASNEIWMRMRREVYTLEEMSFVSLAMRQIPPDALVINAPNDGSVFAYGCEGMNTLFRDIGTSGRTRNADVLRTRLCEYATSGRVRRAVEETGAQYVLLLDRGVAYEDGEWLWQYGEDQVDEWRGINGVDDNTPGFTPVLFGGDEMRLYRIDPAWTTETQTTET